MYLQKFNRLRNSPDIPLVVVINPTKTGGIVLSLDNELGTVDYYRELRDLHDHRFEGGCDFNYDYEAAIEDTHAAEVNDLSYITDSYEDLMLDD